MPRPIASMRHFLAEALGHLGEPWASPRRYRIAFVFHAVIGSTAVLAPTAWNYLTIPIFQTEPARSVLRAVWFPTSGLVVLLSALGCLIPVRSEQSGMYALQRLLMFAVVFFGVCSNGTTTWLYGMMASSSVGIFVALIAIYRVALDYVTALEMTLCCCVYWVVMIAAELNGWVPLHPLAPGMKHPAYEVPEITSVMLTGGPIILVITFMATNYGVNQAVLLHQYITDSVLRRYLPESMVRRAARGDLDLEGPPERREVTVMFTDLVGFTSLSERLGAEAVGALLNRYLAGVANVAHAHGATVDKFVGDGVMIVFGAPEALEPDEQARRAVHLAREIHASVGSLPAEPPLEARTGINTGEVVVGNFGSRWRSDYTVIGPAVNIAARLESASEPGRILVGERTAQLLGLGHDPVERRLKGVSGPVKAWFLD